MLIFVALHNTTHNVSVIIDPVPEMDGRQMRLLSYSGDQKLLQIR